MRIYSVVVPIEKEVCISCMDAAALGEGVKTIVVKRRSPSGSKCEVCGQEIEETTEQVEEARKRYTA